MMWTWKASLVQDSLIRKSDIWVRADEAQHYIESLRARVQQLEAEWHHFDKYHNARPEAFDGGIHYLGTLCCNCVYADSQEKATRDAVEQLERELANTKQELEEEYIADAQIQQIAEAKEQEMGKLQVKCDALREALCKLFGWTRDFVTGDVDGTEWDGMEGYIAGVLEDVAGQEAERKREGDGK